MVESNSGHFSKWMNATQGIFLQDESYKNCGGCGKKMRCIENIMVSKKNLKVLINFKEFYKNIKRDFLDYTNSAFYYSA